MTEIYASKVITVTGLLSSANGVVTLPTNSLTFAPDECIIKSINFWDQDATIDSSGVYSVFTNLTNSIVCTFATDVFYHATTTYIVTCNLTPNIRLLLKNSVTGDIKFILKNESNSKTDGGVGITVEFIQYKKK